MKIRQFRARVRQFVTSIKDSRISCGTMVSDWNYQACEILGGILVDFKSYDIIVIG